MLTGVWKIVPGRGLTSRKKKKKEHDKTPPMASTKFSLDGRKKCGCPISGQSLPL